MEVAARVEVDACGGGLRQGRQLEDGQSAHLRLRATLELGMSKFSIGKGWEGLGRTGVGVEEGWSGGSEELELGFELGFMGVRVSVGES